MVGFIARQPPSTHSFTSRTGTRALATCASARGSATAAQQRRTCHVMHARLDCSWLPAMRLQAACLATQCKQRLTIILRYQALPRWKP